MIMKISTLNIYVLLLSNSTWSDKIIQKQNLKKKNKHLTFDKNWHISSYYREKTMENKSRMWSAWRFNDYSSTFYRSVDKQLYDEEAELK